MKIYFLSAESKLSKKHINMLRKLGDFELALGNRLTENNLVEKVHDADVLLAGRSGVEIISKKVIENLKYLKLISIVGIGYEWIDVEAARDKDVTICIAKEGNSQSVAEHIWGMIIDLSKRITEFNRDLREKGVFDFKNYLGKEVFRKTIGILGVGSVGKRVAKIAKSFDMKVLGFSKTKKNIDGVEFTDQDTILKNSDIIAVCLPLTNDTENLISEKEIGKMKNGVIIVNCAREKIVNKSAITQAVTSRKIFAYGVETEIMQPIEKNDIYLKHPRILVTPHNAWNTKEARERTYEIAIENIQTFLKGDPMNVIN